MEVLKGEQFVWNDKGIFLECSASHCPHFCLCFYTWQHNSSFFHSFLFHFKDFSYKREMLHDLQMEQLHI